MFCAVELIRIQLVSHRLSLFKIPTFPSYSTPPPPQKKRKKGETSYPSPSSFDCSTCRWYSIVLASVGFSDAGLVGEVVVLRERVERGVVGLVGGDIVCCVCVCVAWRMQDVGL